MNLKVLSFLIVLFTLPLIFQPVALNILKLKLFDALVETPESSGNFVILNLTEEDVDDAGGYPFPRETLANIHIDILNKGALGVGWVLAFPHKDRLGGDEYFKQALSYAPSVVAVFENNSQIYPKTEGTVILGENTGGYLSQGIVKNIDGLNVLEGVASAPVDVDNLVRRVPLLYRTPEGWIASFGTQVLKALTGAKTYIIKTNENGIEEVTVKGVPPVKVDSLGRKWISWVNTPETTLKELDVENKFVFVGVTAKGVMPQLATPVGLLEPHKVQAALAESILIENSPFIPDYSVAVEVLILLFLLLVWVVLSNFGVTAGVTSFSLLMIGTSLLGYYIIKQGILIDVSWSIISQFTVGSIIFYFRFREQYKLRQQIKKQFEHYLDPRQVKQLQKKPELLKLGGEKRNCTFLFTDVRGFTALSEKLEPEQVTEIMNKTLTIQSNAVKEYGGMVDKYIGDAMMAIFNAPIDLPNHEDKAIKTALKIIEDMEKADVGVTIGIGINTGEAVIGNMGSESRFDYSAIGDPVNTAARLESATKEVGVNLLIGENTKQNTNYKLQLLEPIKVKGKKESLNIYTYE